MTTYARIINGIMVERIDPLLDEYGNEIPIDRRFHPDFVAQLTQIDIDNPPPTQLPPEPTPDWRPQAIADFNVMRKSYMDTLTSMQIDYQAQGKDANAAAVLAAKQALKDLDKSPSVQAVYTNPNSTREQYNQIVKQTWYAAIGTAPAEVLADFPKYGGNAL